MFRKVMILGLVLMIGVFSVAADEDEEKEDLTTYAGAPTRIVGNWAALGNLFQTEYGYEVWRWNPDTEMGEHEFYATYEAIRDAKYDALISDDAVLVETSGDISLWALPDSTCQLDSPMVDGSIYSLAFDC